MSKQAPPESKDTTTKPQIQERKEIPVRQTSQETKDIFSTCRQALERLFDETRKTSSEFQQSIANLQNDCAETCRKAFEASISFQEELASKSPFYPQVGDTALKAGNNLVEIGIKTYEMQTRVALEGIRVTTQNIKSMNENSRAFQNMSKTLLDTWSFLPREN
ncbi:MAG: hypothetical protein KGI27_12560 [Thaumarchaeota archaeon]|nr:hypothetical protein [Nitrososphaerota archaeon]